MELRNYASMDHQLPILKKIMVFFPPKFQNKKYILNSMNNQDMHLAHRFYIYQKVILEFKSVLARWSWPKILV